MNKYEITKKIENFAPVETAESWDCVGFMVETKNQNISKIMLCLTPTEDVITQAISQNCDMVISHHPMFCIDCNSGFVSESFMPMIDIYSAHTNMDKAIGGTTDTVIKALGFDNFKINIEHDFLRFIEFDKPILVEEFSKKIKQISPMARFVNNNQVSTLQKIAFCAGSGSEFIEEAKNLGIDCLVTGDLKFHTALDSEIVVYDIGHFESEILILPVFERLIGSGVEVVYAKEKNPFITC